MRRAIAPPADCGMFVCRNDLECPDDKDFDEHYHSFEKCVVCGKLTTCAECLCGTSRP